MADNVELNPGSGGAILAADEIAGVMHQRVKIQHGEEGSAADVSTASPLPVAGPLTDAQLRAADVKVTLDGETVAVASQPARAATTDAITAKLATDALHDGTTALTPKFAKIACAANGDNELVAAVQGKKLRVLAVAVVQSKAATGAAGAYFKSGASTAIHADATHRVPLDKSGAAGPAGLVLGFNPLGWFETAGGEALNLNLDAAQGVCGGLNYVEV